jgi:hypothetical protein
MDGCSQLPPFAALRRRRRRATRSRNRRNCWNCRNGLGCPNFKPASNQTKIQKFFLIIFIIKHVRKTRIFLKNKIEDK